MQWAKTGLWSRQEADSYPERCVVQFAKTFFKKTGGKKCL